MRSKVLAALLMTCALAKALAQDAKINYSPVKPFQYGFSVNSAVFLTPPAGATYAVITCSATTAYTLDGTTTPTSSVGQQLAVGAQLNLYGSSVITNAQLIATGGTGTCTAYYFM